MRIAFIGAGGVGGYFGGNLAKAGADVSFVARGAHLAAIRERGLTVESPVAPVAALRVRATDRAEAIGPVDLVVVTAKLWDLEGAVRANLALVGPETTVLTVQNGVEAPGMVSGVVGAERTAVGVCHIATTIAGPGVVRHTGTMARMTVGDPDGRPRPVLDAYVAAARGAGLDVTLAADIRRTLWEKYVFLSALSGLTALTRLPVGPIRTTPATRALFAAAVEETAALARASGAALPPDHGPTLMGFVDTLPAGMKASMLHDLERGNRLELPWLSGGVARLSAERGLDAPVHRTIAAALAPFTHGAPAV
jgi:2-dehydropantoate 2-reductase